MSAVLAAGSGFSFFVHFPFANHGLINGLRIVALHDANFDSMRRWAMTTRVRQLAVNHLVTEHVAMKKFAWCYGLNTAAGVVEMKATNVVDFVRRAAPIVPLPAHDNCLFHNSDPFSVMRV